MRSPLVQFSRFGIFCKIHSSPCKCSFVTHAPSAPVARRAHLVEAGTNLQCIPLNKRFPLYFRNKVYMGKPSHHGGAEPKKNMLDKMFEQIMHSTGHEQMRRRK